MLVAFKFVRKTFHVKPTFRSCFFKLIFGNSLHWKEEANKISSMMHDALHLITMIIERKSTKIMILSRSSVKLSSNIVNPIKFRMDLHTS